MSAGEIRVVLVPSVPMALTPLPTELLSAQPRAACSPRLSPDGRRLLYLEGAVGGPHRQCLKLRMVRGLRVLGRPSLLGRSCPPNPSRSPNPPCLSFPIGVWLSPAHLAEAADGDGA